MKNISFIKENNIVDISLLSKGWSGDEKYILTDINNVKYLLRKSNPELYEKRKTQFNLLQEIEKLNINCVKPIEFGVLQSKEVYTILTFLEGEDAEEAILKLTDEEAYNLGIEAGIILKKIHSIKIPKQSQSWWERYQLKMQRKIDALIQCEYRLPMQEEIIKYYRENAYLMKERPLVFTHGDYHLGNMIINDKHIGIIDFDKINPADPYDEFKPFCWNVIRNEYFETGLINGYFENKIPVDFFKILKFYTAESLISHLPWATKFGNKEVSTALEISNKQMEWYDNFELTIPKWYKSFK